MLANDSLVCLGSVFACPEFELGSLVAHVEGLCGDMFFSVVIDHD